MSEKDEEIQVREEQDGSVTAELPEGVDNPQVEEDDGQEEQETQVEAHSDDDDTDRPDDTEAIREARRARRRAKKDLIRKTNQEKDQRLVFLQKQNEELMDRLSVVERKTHSSDIARVDSALENEQARMQYALTKIKQATEAGDGDAMIKAQDLLYETRKRLEAIQTLKKRMTDTATQQSNPINPNVQRHAKEWMERNPWYDIKGNDEDTAIAKLVDERLMEEGYNPASPDYWDELDERLQKRLPHLYNRTRRETSGRRPKSFVTSSERETGGASGRNTFTLSPEQVRAMKDAGFWDDPDKRNKMIKRYATEARNSRS